MDLAVEFVSSVARGIPVRRIVSALTVAGFATIGSVPACSSSAATDSSQGNGGSQPPPPAVTVTVQVDQDRTAISPYIYGSNQDDGTDVWTVRREGGNRTTGYNWENNFSNAGSDYIHSSDLYMITSEGLPASAAATPARAVTFFHDQSIAMGAQSVVTLQMAGYVSKDGNGTVQPSEVAPSPRWVSVSPKKPTAFSQTPDLTDGQVYMDEFVNALVVRYGNASTPHGVRWYSLDNEPALWSSTHPRIHPQPVGAAELLNRSVALAAATKAVDPGAEIIGPAAYGIMEFFSLQDAPDWSAVKQGYEWFTDYYLDGMRKAALSAGTRLLDVLDVHWYPEARGDNRITDANATTQNDASARMQAPRSLWDSTYRESSWITQSLPAFLPLLPKLQRSIDQYYPGTRLSVSEYDYGGGKTVSGGIAQADVLGVFGERGIYLATIWGMDATRVYTSAGFKLYRDYDGNHSSYGNIAVRARTSDVTRTSVHAAINGGDPSTVHLILLSKEQRDSLTVRVQLTGGATYSSAQAWGFDANSATITPRGGVTSISGNAFNYTVPPLTALHLIVK
jgi:mannan endo-1,4-beta-mannosidase